MSPVASSLSRRPKNRRGSAELTPPVPPVPEAYKKVPPSTAFSKFARRITSKSNIRGPSTPEKDGSSSGGKRRPLLVSQVSTPEAPQTHAALSQLDLAIDEQASRRANYMRTYGSSGDYGEPSAEGSPPKVRNSLSKPRISPMEYARMHLLEEVRAAKENRPSELPAPRKLWFWTPGSKQFLIVPAIPRSVNRNVLLPSQTQGSSQSHSSSRRAVQEVLESLPEEPEAGEYNEVESIPSTVEAPEVDEHDGVESISRDVGVREADGHNGAPNISSTVEALIDPTCPRLSLNLGQMMSFASSFVELEGVSSEGNGIIEESLHVPTAPDDSSLYSINSVHTVITHNREAADTQSIRALDLAPLTPLAPPTHLAPSRRPNRWQVAADSDTSLLRHPANYGGHYSPASFVSSGANTPDAEDSMSMRSMLSEFKPPPLRLGRRQSEISFFKNSDDNKRVSRFVENFDDEGEGSAASDPTMRSTFSLEKRKGANQTILTTDSADSAATQQKDKHVPITIDKRRPPSLRFSPYTGQYVRIFPETPKSPVEDQEDKPKSPWRTIFSRKGSRSFLRQK